MKTEILRKKPRINLSLAGIFIVDGDQKIACRIVNSSESGVGIVVSKSVAARFKKNPPERGELLWALVPSLPLERWKVRVRRIFKDSLGLELKNENPSSPKSTVLKKLIHFHLNGSRAVSSK
jgi:hypothetical protein